MFGTSDLIRGVRRAAARRGVLAGPHRGPQERRGKGRPAGGVATEGWSTPPELESFLGERELASVSSARAETVKPRYPHDIPAPVAG
jgi:hypothetical protein